MDSRRASACGPAPRKVARPPAGTWRRAADSAAAALANAGIRIVPIFPELHPFLLDAFEAAEDGAVHCCPQHGPNAGQVYRKYILRAIETAGLKPWPKLFQNLRSTRETELCERFPVHVAAAWVGNSPRVAVRHYLQTTEDHYAKAVQEAVQNPVQSAAASSRKARNGEREGAKTPRIHGAAACSVGDIGLEPMTLRV